jgi:glycosyltransferase involved in cell wall biosynthesis
VWCGKRVSLILPTYNEKDSIRASIDEFDVTGILDEIIVVNNNAAEGTSAEVALTAAREVVETTQGYGAAIRCGFRQATGDYIIVAEPDGTFRGHDLRKVLAYAEDFEVVYGSRTVKELIWEGANMGLFLKWGNYAVAKLMEFLFNTTSLTDVGCTMRCIRREALRDIEPYFTVNGSFFGPEMMVISILKNKSMIQVPVNYTKRVGTSSVTGSLPTAIHLGFQMIGLILSYRLKSWRDPLYFEAASKLPTLDLLIEPDEIEKEDDGA